MAAAAEAPASSRGTGHLAGTVVFSGYVPGALTAPLLLWTGFLLLRELAGSARP